MVSLQYSLNNTGEFKSNKLGIALAVGLTTLNDFTGVVKSGNIGENPNAL